MLLVATRFGHNLLGQGTDGAAQKLRPTHLRRRQRVLPPPAGFVGLALSYALSVTSLLGSLVTSFTDTEKELVSVERAGQYLRDLEEEPLEGMLLVGGHPVLFAVRLLPSSA